MTCPYCSDRISARNVENTEHIKMSGKHGGSFELDFTEEQVKLGINNFI